MPSLRAFGSWEVNQRLWLIRLIHCSRTLDLRLQWHDAECPGLEKPDTQLQAFKCNSTIQGILIRPLLKQDRGCAFTPSVCISHLPTFRSFQNIYFLLKLITVKPTKFTPMVNWEGCIMWRLSRWFQGRRSMNKGVHTLRTYSDWYK